MIASATLHRGLNIIRPPLGQQFGVRLRIIDWLNHETLMHVARQFHIQLTFTDVQSTDSERYGYAMFFIPANRITNPLDQRTSAQQSPARPLRLLRNSLVSRLTAG